MRMTKEMPTTFQFRNAMHSNEQSTAMKLDVVRSSSREIWENAINTLLTALENILLDNNGMPIKLESSEADRRLKKLYASEPMILEEFEDSFGSLSPLKRKRDDDNQRKYKCQKISNTYEATRSSFSSPQRNIKNFTSRLFDNKRARKHVTSFSNTFDMDMMVDNNSGEFFDSDTKLLVHEPARIQKLRRILSNPDDNYCNWNVTITDWIELQAQKRNMSLQEFQSQFQERICDMESTLKILHNSIPQAFDGIMSLIDRFLNNAEWLRCDYCKPFIQIFPQWQTLGKNVENIVQYVEIVEDMKATVNSEYPQNKDIGCSLQRVLEVLEFKKSLYGEVLQQSGLSWKALGFPVEDNWFHAMRQWLSGLAFNCSAIMINEMNKYDHSNADDIRTTKIMENIMSCIKITSCTVELIGSPNNELISSSLILATFYVNLSLSQIDKMESKVRCVEVRIMHICNNINHILHQLLIVQDTYGQDITFTIDSEEYQQSLKNVENFATALVEVGLRLCEHIAKPKTNTVTSPASFTHMYLDFVIKFINRALEYSGIEESVEIRMRPLLASLRNIEDSLSSV
ncbi:18032_t:CDS:2 [Cetraspora pellucida]|uniref:18032_t:CDS:1 n=1 Tax=Cetraspora pellucida TaxID=1433469 RepID=A0ACA9KV60_9GLOM|nr:18032_t:CDS:2 [Cetraspora pellucida]